MADSDDIVPVGPLELENVEQTIVVDASQLAEHREKSGKLPKAEPAKAHVRAPCVYVLNPGGAFRNTIDSERYLTVLGSSREVANIVVHGQEVSKKHVVIIEVAQHWMLMDCGVKDVVSYNGVEMYQFAAAQNCRCVIRIGSKYVIFCGDENRRPFDSDMSHLTAGPFGEVDAGPLTDGSFLLKVDDHEVKSWGSAILVGRHDLCDINISGSGAKPFHCLVFWHPSGIRIDPMGNRDVMINGNPVPDVAELPANASVQVGPSVLTMAPIGDIKTRCQQMFPESLLFPSQFGFTALDDSQASSFSLPRVGRGVTIGRGETADITINDSSASREHAQMIPSGKSLMLIDTYSANGVFVNGEKITKTRVHAGDIIEMGQSYFLMHYL